MSDKQQAPERIWLSRGNARGSWEFSGCWGIHPFGAGENVEYRRVESPSEAERETTKALIEAIASPWICVEDKPCEETVAVHWEELITALSAAIAADCVANTRAAKQ